MAQIESTIKLELESQKQTWADMFKTAGMRRRVLISTFLGLFTQMSGNTLLSYYSSVLFSMMGYTTPFAKTRINIANQCWSLLVGVGIALIVPRFPRRNMFMLSAGSILCVFTAMTVSFNRLQVAEDTGVKNTSAGVAALFFYFAFAPCYNIGNNGLTYSESLSLLAYCPDANCLTAYLVELFPYTVRTMGIGIEQIWGKLGGFFSIYVNPIALDAIGWKFFAIYCGWIFFELSFVYLFYPETYGRTLEELAFCKSLHNFHQNYTNPLSQCSRTRSWPTRPSPPSRNRCTTSHTARSAKQRSSRIRCNSIILGVRGANIMALESDARSRCLIFMT
jgi:hypothetical protein